MYKRQTYAVPMIIGEIRRYLRDNNSVRVSRSMRDTAYKAMLAKEKLIAQKQQEPTIEEIAKELDKMCIRDRFQIYPTASQAQIPAFQKRRHFQQRQTVKGSCAP